jgi:UDP-galactopyranose mutase
MNISLDFDDTYTRDPILWDNFVVNARRHGHKVYVVTMRYKEEGQEVYEALAENVDQIIFTGRMAKKPYVEAKGIDISVWIDDNPFAVYNDMQPLPYSVYQQMDVVPEFTRT